MAAYDTACAIPRCGVNVQIWVPVQLGDRARQRHELQRLGICNGEITTYFFVQIAVLRVSSRMPDRFCREKRLRQDWERRLDAEKQKNCPQRNAAGGLPACVGMRSDAFKSHVLIVERRSDLDEQNSAASSGSFRFDDAAFEPGRPADGPIFCVWAGAEGIH